MRCMGRCKCKCDGVQSVSPKKHVWVCAETQIASAERNNKTELNVKPSLSNFNAGAANKGVRAYSNFCSLHINIWCFTGANENLSGVMKGICLRKASGHTSDTSWPSNIVGREATRPSWLNYVSPHKTTEVSFGLLQLMHHLPRRLLIKYGGDK